MNNDNSPENFAQQRRAVIVAPAGYGKTELIARACACSNGRQLILTHTHAGVDSIAKRLKEKYHVPVSKYTVETIHSFALRFAACYPKTTGLTTLKPKDAVDYKQIINCAIKLFDIKLGKDILKASYEGLFVDEYQDCGIDQHELICKLAESLRCRVVGDPLQGIFDFGDAIVNWDRHVFTFFEQLKPLSIPHRWQNTCPELGERLKALREILLAENVLPMRAAVQDSQAEITRFLKSESFTGENIYVICEPKNANYTHWLAGLLGNRFKTIEPITSNDLVGYARSIETSNGLPRLEAVMHFCNDCLTKIAEANNVVKSFTVKPKRFINSRKQQLAQHFRNIFERNDLEPVYNLFLFFEKAYEPTCRRSQLWHEMKKGLQEVLLQSAKSLTDAVWSIRNQVRFKENRIPKRCISRTLLLKGLECDHAIIIKPELFDKKNLYVALTRASSKVTIITNSDTWSNY